MLEKLKAMLDKKRADEIKRFTKRVAELEQELKESYTERLKLWGIINEQGIKIHRFTMDNLDATLKELKEVLESWDPVTGVIKFPNGSSVRLTDPADQGAQYHGEDNCLLE